MADTMGAKSKKPKLKGGEKNGVKGMSVDNDTRIITYIEPTDRKLAKNASRTVGGGNAANKAYLNRGSK